MTSKTSIDKAELEKFSKLSHRWWDLNGEFKILHQINPLRLQFIKDKIQSHFNVGTHQLSQITALDVGCGGGLVTVPLHEYGINITGLDASEENILTAKNYSLKRNLTINYINNTVECLVAEGLQYDVLLCLELVEHVANIDDFIKNLKALIKPNGMLIISTLNRTIKSYLLGIIAAEYLLKWVPKNTHEYSKFLKPSELYHLLNDNQINLKELRGFNFNLLSQSWQIDEDISVNYLAYACPSTDV